MGNKLGTRHINFEKNKMNVKLAVQTVASDSVARTLRWAYHNSSVHEELKDFNDPDMLVTAEFLETHDKIFDICNSRSKHGPQV